MKRRTPGASLRTSSLGAGRQFPHFRRVRTLRAGKAVRWSNCAILLQDLFVGKKINAATRSHTGLRR